MVFTQYTDTMRFLRDELQRNGERGLMCFSGSRRRDTDIRRELEDHRPGRGKA